VKAGAASGGLGVETTSNRSIRAIRACHPPGKGIGREHQDLRRRHLLVKEIVNDPRSSNIAALRPLEHLSAANCGFRQLISRAFQS
jgi:hypothetical protein